MKNWRQIVEFTLLVSLSKRGKNGVVVVGEHGVNGDTYLIKMGEIIVYSCVC